MTDIETPDVSTPERLVAHIVGKGVQGEAYGIDYADRVTKGIAHLDEKLPDWWHEDREHPISLDTLHVANPYRCVSAQLSGVSNFSVGQNMLGLTSTTTMNLGTYLLLGFNVENYDQRADHAPDKADDYDEDGAFELLTGLWKNVIRVRRGMPVDPSA